jgi:hypothetical protein
VDKKAFVKDISTLGWWTQWKLKRQKPIWMMDPFTGNVYSFVVYKDELYLVYENGMNRNGGNA